MKLPQSFIDEVLSRTDIIEVIEQRLTLKKTGRANYSGLCPFHQEKTPSFTVSHSKQFYYCFGCKASGNAIGFLMAYEKLSFFEAVESLAAKANLPLPDTKLTKQDEKTPHYHLLEQSAKYYQKALEQQQKAKQYLLERGLTPEVIKHFKLGFAPNRWDNLTKIFGSEPAIKKSLLEAGMLIQKNATKVYDRFRDRIMFPIRNRRGQIIAFGGRSMDGQMPKYLNSPETSLFHKSHELYGLYEALQANKEFKRMIVVEGYLDAITLHQYGLTETVATLGTAISIHHIQTLLRFTSSLIFCFDGDLAGRSAAWRALEIALNLVHTGVQIRFLFLPNGEDPDSFIRKTDVNEFKEKIEEAVPLVDFFFQKLQSETEIESLAGKTRFVYHAQKYLLKLPKGIFQELMYEKLSKYIGLSLPKIEELLQPKPQEKRITSSTINTKSLIPPLKLAISLLLQAPKLLNELKIPPEFGDIKINGIELLTKIMAIIHEYSPQNTGSLLEYWEEDQQKPQLIEFAAQDLLIPDIAWQNELQGALERLLEIDKEQRIQLLLAKGKKLGLSPEERKLLQTLLIIRNKS